MYTYIVRGQTVKADSAEEAVKKAAPSKSTFKRAMSLKPDFYDGELSPNETTHEGFCLAMGELVQDTKRTISLAKSVYDCGGLACWNMQNEEQKALIHMIEAICTAKTKQEALVQLTPMIELGNYLWAYMYMRKLAEKNIDVFFEVILSKVSYILPVLYTPTVGEVCQKFGMLPMYKRGLYLSVTDKGNLKKAIQEYADAECPKDKDGKPLCDCIVFSDGGRILGLGDLAAFGMGIPIGKLDLYTACGGVNPYRTIPCIIDAGCSDPEGNTAHLDIRGHPLYTGVKKDRVKHRTEAGTMVNSCYYGPGNMIEEFMKASVEIFGKHVLMQFEDFNSNDAFLLLDEYREKYLTYNDDIQGTAAITVAGILGALKLKKPHSTDLIGELKKETIMFHGAGSANLGAMFLLHKQGGVPKEKLLALNSRGLIWKSADGSEGSFRNDEQKEFAKVGAPTYEFSIPATIKAERPSVLVGATGVAPNSWTKEVVEAMMEVGREGDHQERPIMFPISNPKSQSEITAVNAYTWSGGEAIVGTGTYFEPVTVKGRTHSPGQVNNVYIFPGMSFGAVACKASTITDMMFLKSAEAVANSLTKEDLDADRVIPERDRVRDVALNVATATALEAQMKGLAGVNLGSTFEEIKKKLEVMMWKPGMGPLD